MIQLLPINPSLEIHSQPNDGSHFVFKRTNSGEGIAIWVKDSNDPASALPIHVMICTREEFRAIADLLC